MEKKMFALTYCYEGYNDCEPYASTIAVSTDIEKLKAEMEKCVEEDCKVVVREEYEYDEDFEEDEWADDKNYMVYRKYDTQITLQHRKNINLYATYKIHSVDCL